MVKNVYLLIGVLVFSVLAIKSMDNTFGTIETIAVEGLLDLSKYDLKTEVVSLNGEWEFYWNELCEPGDYQSQKKYIKVPSDWNRTKEFENEGFATYRLQIIVPSITETAGYGIYLNRVGSAYEIFVNGVKRGSNGKVGIKQEQEIPHRETKTIYFDLDPYENLELVIHVSNHNHLLGGLKTGVLFSTAKVIQQTRFGFLFVDFLAVAMLAVLMIVCSSIYFFKAEKQFLYFSLYLMFICIYVAGTGENVLGSLLPELPWIVFMKLIHICMALHFLFYNNILNLLYPREKITFLYQIIQKTSLAFSVIFLCTSVKIFVLLLPIFHIIILLSVIYWLLLMIRAIVNNKRDSIIIFLGLSIYAIAVGLEVAYVNQIGRNPRFVPIGVLFFSLSYIIVSTKEFASTYKLVENAEREKHQAIAQVSVEKAAFLAEKERSTILHQTLINSESSGQVDKIRENLRRISYIISESGGCKAYDDQGVHLFDSELTLKKITEIFGINNQLIRCSKAYVVNPSKALKVVRNGRRFELQFLNSTVANIPVGNRYVTDVRDSIQAN